MENNSLNMEEIKTFLLKNNYQFQRYLGKGNFSDVVQAYSNEFQVDVAVKIFNKEKQDIQKEIQILEKLKGEYNFVQIISKIIDSDMNISAVVTELYDCDLETILSLNKFSFQQILALTQQLLQALLVLQCYGVIHSDVKPSNILFSRTKNMFALSDFGLAHQIKDPLKENTISSLNGNLNYKSPEVYKEEKPYTLKVDVFSIGAVILQCLLEGKLKVHQFISLKSQLLVKVIPDIKTHPNYDFIEKIISCMINFKKEERLEPLKLIQKLNSIYMQKIDVKCLNELVLPKKQEFSQPKVKKSVSSVKQTSYIHEQQTKIQNFESMQYQQVQQLPVFYKTYSQPNFSLNNFLPPNPNQGRIYKIKKITAITPIYYNFDQQNQMYGQMTSAPYTPQNQQYSKPPQKKYPDDYYDY
ncbi:hypothetical protein ABPG73_016883 [Tetrahymena malaccensis]